MDGPVHRPGDRAPADPEARRQWRRWWLTIGAGVALSGVSAGLWYATWLATFQLSGLLAILRVGHVTSLVAVVAVTLWAWRWRVRPAWVRWSAPPLIAAFLITGSIFAALTIINVRSTSDSGDADAHHLRVARDIAAYLGKGDRNAEPPSELRFLVPIPMPLPGAARPEPYVTRSLSGQLQLTTYKSGRWRLEYKPFKPIRAEICVFSGRCVAGRCGTRNDPQIEDPC
jgi:hypothetical protein